MRNALTIQGKAFQTMAVLVFRRCCGRSHNEPGCVINDAHVWNGVVGGVNEFLKWKGYVNTVYRIPTNINDFQVYGIVCEMCYRQQDLEDNQIIFIDMYDNVVYQTYIKPEIEIIDYNSGYNGIYESALEGIQITLPQLQNILKNFIHSNTVLVGHDLGNDLRALRFSHPNCFETSILFPRAFLRNSLKYLASYYLSREIQCSRAHFPEEDARTATDLIFYYLIKQHHNNS